jgi:glycosyltransferase involved in cell wall biosynthesis
MLIGIDNISPGASTGSGCLGGMRHFIQSLIMNLPALDTENEYVFFTPGRADDLGVLPSKNLRIVKCWNVPISRVGRVFYEQIKLPSEISRHEISLWIGTCNILPLVLHSRSILFVQSLQFFTIQEAYTRLQNLYFRTLVPASLRRADHLVTFSETCKDYIVNRLGILPGKVTVIQHAFRFPTAAISAYDAQREKNLVSQYVKGNYILCVSAFYPYKNLERLLEAFARISQGFDYKLVLIGAETRLQKQAHLNALAQRLGIEADVIFLGPVSDELLPMFYRQATLMAMPSLDETFGLPLLEAMAFGCPVVTSNMGSMREVVGQAGVLVDPYNIDSITAGLRRVLSDSELKQHMANAGKIRSRSFTYERFFKSLVKIIETVGNIRS